MSITPVELGTDFFVYAPDQEIKTSLKQAKQNLEVMYTECNKLTKHYLYAISFIGQPNSVSLLKQQFESVLRIAELFFSEGGDLAIWCNKNYKFNRSEREEAKTIHATAVKLKMFLDESWQLMHALFTDSINAKNSESCANRFIARWRDDVEEWNKSAVQSFEERVFAEVLCFMQQPQ